MCKFIEQTKQADRRIARAAAYHAYGNPAWTYSDIFAAYARPSAAKIEAWNYCRELCRDLNGYNLRISSRNTYRFSAVFTYTTENGSKAYAYITPEHDRFAYAVPEEPEALERVKIAAD